MKRFCVSLLIAAFAASGVPATDVTTDIYWIDVNGGAATLIVTPAGESILIDSGENTAIQASRIHSVLTRAAGLKQIDHLIISHWHADHYGGTYELSKLTPINNHYGNSEAPPDNVADDPAFSVLMPLYRRVNSGPVKQLRAGALVPLKQRPGSAPISLRSLAADRRTIDPPRGAPRNALCAKAATAPPLDDGENAKSLVLLLKFGGFSFLDAGDLTWHIEERMACPVNLAGEVDLYQVTHHGMDRSNNPHLVHAIRPRVAVVNNGSSKGAEAKSMRTLQTAPRLEAVWQLYRNTTTGQELNAPDKRIANPTGTPGGNYLKASIRSDGSFSLQAGEAGYRETYESGARKVP